VPAGNVLSQEGPPYTVPFVWGDGIPRWDFQQGPGFVRATSETALAQNDPRGARVKAMGKLDVLARRLSL